MRCFNCGKGLPDNARFCSGCGEEQGFSEELLCRARSGEQGALSELYRRTYGAAYRTAAVLIRDEDAVMDILQDSYVKAFRNLHQLREADKFRAWMKRIVHNSAVDWLRKRKPVIFSEMSYESESAAEIPDDRTCSLPDAVIDQRETARLMGEILDSLSEEQRAVVVMYYYEQMTVREIADELGANENTVKSRLLHGRRNIEAGVKNLEKQGTKLYGLAPVPFLLFLFRNWEVQAAPLPDPSLFSSVLQGWNHAVSTSGTVSDGVSGAAGGTGAAAGTDAAANAAAGAAETGAAAGTAAAGTGAGAAAGAAGAGTVSAGAAAAGAAGKALAVKILIGILATGTVGGTAGAVFYYNSQKEQETSPAEMPEEPEALKDTDMQDTDTQDTEELPAEMLSGAWEAHVREGDEKYIMTLDFQNSGQVEYMTGWEQSEAALLSAGTYTVRGDTLHMTFEEDQVSGETINWECSYRFAVDDETLEMEYVSGDSINRFQEEGDICYYSRTEEEPAEGDPEENYPGDTFVLSAEDEIYIREQLQVPEEAAVEFETGEEYYWEGAGMTLVPVSIYENGVYVAGADVDKETKEIVQSIVSYQN